MKSTASFSATLVVTVAIILGLGAVASVIPVSDADGTETPDSGRTREQ